MRWRVDKQDVVVSEWQVHRKGDLVIEGAEAERLASLAAAGNTFVFDAGQGILTFSLRGSKAAIDDLRTRCEGL